MPKALERGHTAAAEAGDLQRFYAEMANGLHAMAQPLTILRSTMVACTLPGMTEDNHRRYLDISVEQVERACGLFQSLQQLVLAHQIEAHCTQVDLMEWLAPVMEDQKALLDGSGVTIKVVKSDDLPFLLADKNRMLQALYAALQIAASFSSSGDIIELLVTRKDRFVELIVQNGRTHGRRLNSSERLRLSLAEANIRSQQGEFECTDDPFRVSMELPVGDLGSVKGRAVSNAVRAHQLH